MRKASANAPFYLQNGASLFSKRCCPYILRMWSKTFPKDSAPITFSFFIADGTVPLSMTGGCNPLISLVALRGYTSFYPFLPGPTLFCPFKDVNLATPLIGTCFHSSQ